MMEGSASQTMNPGQAELLRQSIANERAALLATYAEVEQ
jgi:hypothetical protein